MKTILAVVVAGLLCGCASVGNLVLGALPGGSTAKYLMNKSATRDGAAGDPGDTIYAAAGADLAKLALAVVAYQEYRDAQDDDSSGPSVTPGAAPTGIDVAGDFYWVTAGRDSEINGRAGE